MNENTKKKEMEKSIFPKMGIEPTNAFAQRFPPLPLLKLIQHLTTCKYCHNFVMIICTVFLENTKKTRVRKPLFFKKKSSTRARFADFKIHKI